MSLAITDTTCGPDGRDGAEANPGAATAAPPTVLNGARPAVDRATAQPRPIAAMIPKPAKTPATLAVMSGGSPWVLRDGVSELIGSPSRAN
jgi:hypothetical protein